MGMTFKQLRESVKRAPIIGPILYEIYLRLFHKEGQAQKIQGGPLAGKSWVLFMRTHMDPYLRGDYEMPLQRAFCQYLMPGMTFYDVGANAGFFTLLAASIVGKTGTVVAFEPHPVTSADMQKQLSANALSNVTVIESAIWDSIGTAQLRDDTIPVMASMVGAAQSKRTIAIKTTTIDEVTKTHSAPDVIKIDIEGAEIEALNGARGLLSSKKPVLLVELHSPQIAAAYTKLMTEFGYETFSLDGKILPEINYAEDRFVVSKALN
jgi:FkbM family methyltransferase